VASGGIEPSEREGVTAAYKGGPLRKDADLEGVMKSFGVPEKQTDRARQSFQRSAEQAKVFNNKKDRLVLPAGVSVDSTPSNGAKERKMETPQATPLTFNLDRNAVLAPLLKVLPDAGTEWSREARRMWRKILEETLDVMYKDKSEE
jgi:hypothetical protein